MSITFASVKWYVTAFLAGFLVFVYLGEANTTLLEAVWLKDGYDPYQLTGTIEHVDSANNRFVVKATNQLISEHSSSSETFLIAFVVNEGSQLVKQDYRYESDLIVGLKPEEPITIDALQPNDRIRIQFADTSTGFTVQRAIIGQ